MATKQDAAMVVAACLARGGATKRVNGRAIEQVVLYYICSEIKGLVLVEMNLDVLRLCRMPATTMQSSRYFSIGLALGATKCDQKK